MERRRAGADAALCECRGGRGGRWACAPRGGSPLSGLRCASSFQSFLPGPQILGLGEWGWSGWPLKKAAVTGGRRACPAPRAWLSVPR